METVPGSLDDIQQARRRIVGFAVRTPLLRLPVDSPSPIYLKLENLQPIGSFKIRGAASKIMRLGTDELRRGVWTASAGNMAQGVAWCARELGIDATAVVPDSAPEAKLAAIRRLGCRIEPVTREQFFEIFRTCTYPGLDGLFVHAFNDPDVMAGNGTIGLEILEDLPNVATVYVPYGGGGLSCGIASALHFAQSSARVIACEPATAAALGPALAAGEPVTVPFSPTFVDGAGSPRVYDEMFPLAKTLLAGAVALTTQQTADAVRLLAERAHVIAEGAGALAVAAALQEAASGPSVCIVSGGNINPAALADILNGGIPA